MAVYRGGMNGPLPEVHAGSALKGDALFTNLGGGRNLIAALTHGKNGLYFDGMNRLAMNAFAAAGQKVPFKQVSRLTGKVPVHGNLIPTLVTFGNVADPNTVRVLDPDNIEAVLGDGFHLNRVILEMVPVGLWPLDFGGPLGEPVTRGIEKRLPWVTSIKGYLSGSPACNPSKELCLEVGHFRRE